MSCPAPFPVLPVVASCVADRWHNPEQVNRLIFDFVQQH